MWYVVKVMMIVVVVGVGFNGLVVVIYLVCYGVDVQVLEVCDIIGGGVCFGELMVFGVIYDYCLVFYLLGVGLLFWVVIDL